MFDVSKPSASIMILKKTILDSVKLVVKLVLFILMVLKRGV